MDKKNLYTEDSIESLDPLAFTRLRPQVYCGSTEYSTQLLVEIVSNAIDEYNLGNGSTIDVEILDNEIKVRDYGQGFIVNSFRDDGKTILEAAFSVLNTSGKYRQDGTYQGTSLGSFGIGSKLTNYLSHYLDVRTVRDGMYEYIHFVEGVFDSRKVGKSTEHSGTCVSWQPSEEFFTHTEVEISKVKDLFKTITCLCKGLTINLTYQGKTETYYSNNGLSDLVDDAVSNKEIIKNRCEIYDVNGKDKIDFILTYTSSYTSTIVPYVNTGLTEKGPHITQIKTILTREFNKFFREKKWLKDKDENLSGDDIQEGMYIVFNLTAPNVAYNAQVKSTVTKIDMSSFNAAIVTGLQNWLSNNEKEVKVIADKAISARKAREAAKKARDAARQPKGKKKAKLANLPTKLVDCSCSDRSKAELVLCEGDSAASGLVAARDAETQAIFGLRGKMINSFKNNSEKVMANAEIVNLIKALGLDLKPNGKLDYNIDKLRYGKIIAATDGDPDGANIRMLIAVNLWNLCPELILNGHFYIAYAPLFRITTSKNEYIYLRDDAALQEYRTKHQGEKYLISRSKGLGESDSEELEAVLLNPETRNVKQVVVKNATEAGNHLEMLMGTSVVGRRQFLLENGDKANSLYETKEELDG